MTSRRRRIWCELLPPEELARRETLDLLERFALEPIIALPPARETPAMAQALGALARRGLRVGLWPLLHDEDGYWPSTTNADRFAARVEASLAFADRAGARVQTLAVDLEPPLDVAKSFMHGETAAKSTAFLGSAKRYFDRSEREAQKRAAETFRALQSTLTARGIETLAAVLPTIVLDLASKAPLWQAILRTPVDDVEWRVVSPMFYTSLLADLLPSKSLTRARALLYEGAALLARTVGSERASISVGLVGPGKLGDEPHLAAPEELALDVGAAIAAGVDDLALFSLESVLARGPEPWLAAFTETDARRPDGRETRTVSGLVRATIWATKPLALFR